MGQYVLLHPSSNSKLSALLRGTFCHSLFSFATLDHFVELTQHFYACEAVYVRFSHIAGFQPKFYIGSTSSFVLDREHSRFRKFLQVRQNKFVLAEVALRFWHKFDNFWLWSVFPVFTGKSNFWALEQALIQLWQPKLNTPFIFEFFNTRKGLIPKQKFSAHRHFGVFSLWRKLRWRTTPQKIRSSLRSKTFYDRVELWSIIQDLGANSLRRFQMEKRIRSNDFGLQGCYMIRKLAINLGEPQRSYCLQAIDRAIKFWKGPPVRRRIPLRAPWILTPEWNKRLRRLIVDHMHTMTPHNITLQTPSTSIVFTKYPSVMDSLCNHKDIATQWADQQSPSCICSTLAPFSPKPRTSTDHIVLEGETMLPPKTSPAFSSIASGSLSNKIFPPEKEIYTALLQGINSWTRHHGLPPLPRRHVLSLWDSVWPDHVTHLTNHITHKDIKRFRSLFPNAVFHNEDKKASSLRIYCPCHYFTCLTNTFADVQIFQPLSAAPTEIIHLTLIKLNRRYGKAYPWALGKGRELPNAYVLPKKKKDYNSGRPIVSFMNAPFRPMLNCIAKLIYQLLPKACPHNLAKGDVFDLIRLLQTTEFDVAAPPLIFNQDLAGFFTSIDMPRFIDSWYLLLQFLQTIMDTHPDAILSVNPTKGNSAGDVVKGRTCRRLNVTRKIHIRDIEDIIRSSLQMTQFSIGNQVYEQIRGSPMGSPLSPALCLMVVALSEEVWHRTFSSTLATMDLSSRFLRYVDNRLCLVDRHWLDDPAISTFLHPDFYGHPIILEDEPDQEFLGFTIEFAPFALRYSPPRGLNQVMAPYSASPITVQLSGFVSRLFLVAKCAFPQSEQFRGFAALHRLYSSAGFSERHLVDAAKPIRKLLQCRSLW